jgi:hypothetical protein
MRVLLSGLLLALTSISADAGMPRGAQLIADEQIADETSGETRATGNAELIIKEFGIVGRAASITVQPKQNQVIFTGNANVSVRSETFSGDTVKCTLDFDRCSAGEPPTDIDQRQAAATTPTN